MPSMKSAMPSHTNIAGQSACTAAIRAKSAQAAPLAVKTWTAKAAVRSGNPGSGDGSVEAII